MLHLVQLSASLTFALLAAHDLRFRRLPNRWVLVVAALYLCAAPLAHTSLISFAQHAATAAIALLISALMFRQGWIGGGDAKLAAVVFLWAGPRFSVSALLLASIGGFGLALAVLAQRCMARSPHIHAHEVPYGVALALAGLAAVWVPLALPSPTPAR